MAWDEGWLCCVTSCFPPDWGRTFLIGLLKCETSTIEHHLEHRTPSSYSYFVIIIIYNDCYLCSSVPLPLPHPALPHTACVSLETFISLRLFQKFWEVVTTWHVSFPSLPLSRLFHLPLKSLSHLFFLLSLPWI